ncbi:NAD(P)H:quinone oxidoreductase [Nibricoccus aquaticus]|uniref:NAD(P)H dehydrogenase (quinone) n=1 Tax=Nibricoccus aquaticus TaxID=2576891 RepID=A0A290QA06_9BACT|nr:NAD(P)H:quinone oxidoreductase [Nibricoccus aquaticus]ATC65489.1 NAD(P)H:quinone oxidoreductase [Nibricoccus aquaticus]
MSTKIKVIFHSLYGHVYQLAEAIAASAREVPGVEVEVLQVAETLPAEVLGKMGALEAKKAFAHIPVADPKKLSEADAILLGSGTRFGSATSQMQGFFDATGGLWAAGALIGKVGGVFASSATQHGGQETTLISMQTFLFHHGMVVVGVPYAAKEQMTIAEISGGSPYGSSTITGGDGSRLPSANELAIARFQGKHTAQIAAKLAAK